VLSETHLKLCDRFFIPNHHFYWTDHFPGRKGGTVAIRKGISYNHVDLPPLISIKATGVCILTSKSEVLLSAVYRSPDIAWNDVDVFELLSCRYSKSLLAGDLNDEHPFLSSVVSSPLGMKLQNLLHINEFDISAPQCPTDYCPARNGGVLDIVAHKNV
jgi:hypothetical protein